MVEYTKYLRNIKAWVHVIRPDEHNVFMIIRGQNCQQGNKYNVLLEME
jgi:hypothetical protein